MNITPTAPIAPEGNEEHKNGFCLLQAVLRMTIMPSITGIPTVKPGDNLKQMVLTSLEEKELFQVAINVGNVKVED